MMVVGPQVPCLLMVSTTLNPPLASSGFEAAITRAIMLGGCNASRASLIGAVIAASTSNATSGGGGEGMAAIPKEWVSKNRRGASLYRYVDAICPSPAATR